MKLLVSILAASLFAPLLTAQTPLKPRVHLAGDSTMADKLTDPPNPEYGWGQLLPKFFKEPAMIVNHAANGRSTRSFISPEGSKRLHLWIPAGVYERQPSGYQDDTHYSAYGAERVAALAVQEMIRLGLPLTGWLR